MQVLTSGYEMLRRSDISYPSWPCSCRFRFQFSFIFQWPSSPVQNIMSGPRQLYQPKARYQFEFLHVLQQSRTEANVYTELSICTFYIFLNVLCIYTGVMEWNHQHSGIVLKYRPASLCAAVLSWRNPIGFFGRVICQGGYGLHITQTRGFDICNLPSYIFLQCYSYRVPFLCFASTSVSHPHPHPHHHHHHHHHIILQLMLCRLCLLVFSQSVALCRTERINRWGPLLRSQQQHAIMPLQLQFLPILLPRDSNQTTNYHFDFHRSLQSIFMNIYL